MLHVIGHHKDGKIAEGKEWMIYPRSPSKLVANLRIDHNQNLTVTNSTLENLNNSEENHKSGDQSHSAVTYLADRCRVSAFRMNGT